MERASTKILLTLLGIITSLFLGMFAISVNINKSAIDEVNKRSIERGDQMRQIFSTQSLLSDNLTKVSTQVDMMNDTMDEMKGEIKDI